MSDKTISISWQEGAGANAQSDPATDINGNRSIVITVAGTAYPQGFATYCPDNDTAAAKTVLDVWAALGKPA